LSRQTRYIIISLCVGLILIGLWLFHFDPGYFLQALKNLKLFYVALAGVFYLLAYFIRSYRWNLLLRGQIRLSVKESWLISCAGNWLNYLIPIRLGEVAKAVIIRKSKKRSAVSILPSIFIDKFFDTLGIFLVLILIPFLHIQLSLGLEILLLILIIVFIVAFLILFISAYHKDNITSILQRVFFWLPERFREQIYHLIELFVNGLNILEHHYSIILGAAVLTLLGIALDSIYFYLIFMAFDIPASFFIVLFGYTLINLSYALPQPPAQLGSNEWMMLIIFAGGFGLTKNAASVIMAFAHVYTALLISALGMLGFGYDGIHSLQQIKNEE